MITLKFKCRPDIIHPEERQKHIEQIDETMSLIIELVNWDESSINEHGDRALLTLKSLNSLKFDLKQSIEEEITE